MENTFSAFKRKQLIYIYTNIMKNENPAGYGNSLFVRRG